MRHSLDPVDARIAAALLLAPRMSWREVGRQLGLAERTVVRRVGPLFADGTLTSTAVRNPYTDADLVPLVLRLQCQPARAPAIAAVLARRSDTNWVEIVGGGHEVCSIHFVPDADQRDRLLFDQLPATPGVVSWQSHELLRTYSTGFWWTGGHLDEHETETLRSSVEFGAAPIDPRPYDNELVSGVISDGRMSYRALAERAGISAITARQRTAALISSGAVRPATELDLRLLGARAEALIWMRVDLARLEDLGARLALHGHVRFAGATTGPANLLVAVAAEDRRALYRYLTESLGPVDGVEAPDVSPILRTLKRTGIVRPGAHAPLRTR